ncbi:MAG: glycosyl transferase [Cellulomonadaceae bacterium]|jgi:cellobiose phosphorylase|nr:glycosyl transferase [Cellulomonadaceae bacterium]
MKFGHFDDAAREYVIETPHTPYPWINYLGSEQYFALLSHQAGGYSFYRDAKLRRLTRYRYNNIPTDVGGRYMFINDGGDVWTPSWLPVKADLDAFEARHGMGYSTIMGERGGLRVHTTFLVPGKETAELQKVTFTNTSDAPKKFSAFPYIEFCLWNAEDDQTNYQRNLNIAEVEVEPKCSVGGSAIYHKTEYRERRDHYAVYGVSEVAAGFDTDRDSFVGAYNYLGEAAVPKAGKATNSMADGWYPIGSFQVDIELAPGESKDIIIVLGYIENLESEKWEDAAHQVIGKEHAHALLRRYFHPGKFDECLDTLKEYWDALLTSYTLDSEDEKLNRMVNTWNQYQCMVTFNMSRSASYFETGIGRGMGFRDSNQDLLGFVHLVPERARERIIDIASTQFPDGSAFHQYQPLTKRGNHVLGSGFNDDPMWLVGGVAAYVKETGDWGILDEPVPFGNEEGTEVPLFEHLTRSVDFVTNNLGPHGLPLIGRADWNDCLNLNCFSTTPGESFQTTGNKTGGVAESTFIGGQFVLYAKEYVEMAKHRKNNAEVKRAQAAIDKMTKAMLTDGWDGNWFLRAYDYYGDPIGTDAHKEGKIWIEPQGFALMAGIGVDSTDPSSAEWAASPAGKTLTSIKEMLDTDHGMVLQYPAYTTYQVHMGEVSTYPPGYKENGGIFCHNNPWVIIGETVAGDGASAFAHYKKITPAYREDISDVHRLEPYVYAQMIAGKEAARHGQAKNSWLTGTAAWNFVTVSQYLLGVRCGFEGLIVDPCLGPDLPEFTVTRVARGATYVIKVKNSGKPGSRASLTVDGKAIDGRLVPYAPAGTTVNIEAVL